MNERVSYTILYVVKVRESKITDETIIKKTSLHFLSAVSAEITSDITFNITSAVGPKPQNFLFVCFFVHPVYPSSN